jgi:hypothetical protein
MVDFKGLMARADARKKERLLDPGPLVEVVNARTPISEWKIHNTHYIGRHMPGNPIYNGSALANPYKINSTCTREQSISQYRKWLWAKLQNTNGEVYHELLRILQYACDLPGISLVCWCAPLPCHGDVVQKALLWLYRNVKNDLFCEACGLPQFTTTSGLICPKGHGGAGSISDPLKAQHG